MRLTENSVCHKTLEAGKNILNHVTLYLLLIKLTFKLLFNAGMALRYIRVSQPCKAVHEIIECFFLDDYVFIFKFFKTKVLLKLKVIEKSESALLLRQAKLH